MIAPPQVRLDHLLALIDDTGLMEHARFGVPRRDHGYATDDAARGLILLMSAPDHPERERAIRTLLSFVIHAQKADGRFHNRMSFDRRWIDSVGSDDSQGRAIWSLLEAAARAPRFEWREAASDCLAQATLPTTRYLRPLVYVGLGARAADRAGVGMDMIERVGATLAGFAEPWPEERLRYANGRIPLSMLAVGDVLGSTELVEKGIRTLDWLCRQEELDGHWSFTPVDGREPGEARPGFDQQPIEAASLAEACLEAWAITRDPVWAERVLKTGSWLAGDNDSGFPLYDPETGATYDGLEETGVNRNQGAESTLSGLAVIVACHRVLADIEAHR